MTFERSFVNKLFERLAEPRRCIHILSGARQVGKTTLCTQTLAKLSVPQHYVIAESGWAQSWIDQQWAVGRALSKQHPQGAVLVIDEIQKIEQWSERVKRLWDEDSVSKSQLKVVLLGSSALLLHKGLSESMAGRYEVLHIPHWSFEECQKAFGVSLDEFIYFGAYPGALIYRQDEERFLQYMQEAIIEPVVARDILSQTIIRKPALLRALFLLASEYSGQILSYNKMLGHMHDAGNTTTLSHYLTLLDQAALIKGIEKFFQDSLRVRQSSPKFQAYNTALTTVASRVGFQNAMQNFEWRGRMIESAIGASLLRNLAVDVYYWRENNEEVDFIIKVQEKIMAIEVKSGRKIGHLQGLSTFQKKYNPHASLLVGTGGVPIETFLTTSITDFF